jgi:hypothetical protein
MHIKRRLKTENLSRLYTMEKLPPLEFTTKAGRSRKPSIRQPG